MSALDEHQLTVDELAERRRARDREREPGRSRPPARDLVRRRAFQAGVIDALNATVDTSIIALECPGCMAPAFAPADSNGEQLECAGCRAQLLTARTSEGVVALLLEIEARP